MPSKNKGIGWDYFPVYFVLGKCASCLEKQGELLQLNLPMEKAVAESSDAPLSLIQTGYG